MKSIQRAHSVVVAGSDQALELAARVRRVEVAEVTAVAAVPQARGLWQVGGTDACIVVFDDAVPMRRRCRIPMRPAAAAAI
jgi:hypothetical protein